MTLVTVEIATLHWRQMTSISPHDFAPIGLVNRDAAAVFVRSDAPVATLRDLEQAIRAAPGTLRASGTATAGIWHLALAGWLTAVGLKPTDVIWVSIAGSAPSLQELHGRRHRRRRPAAWPRRRPCSIRAASAVSASWRASASRSFRSVPTLQEQGVDFSLGTLRGLAVPRDVPPDRIRASSPTPFSRVAHERGVSVQPVERRLHAGVRGSGASSRATPRADRQPSRRALLHSDAFAGLASQAGRADVLPGPALQSRSRA